MKKSLIPSKNNAVSDRVYTPDNLAQKIVSYFKPFGKKCLDPCKGKGAFLNSFNNIGINADWCEIDEGKDFFQYNEKVDWIISNFPWSIHRKFLQHSMSISDNIVTLVTVNHVIGLKARLNDVRDSGFFIREIITFPTPKEFPQSGFQLGAVYLNKKQGDCKFTHWQNYD
jgi:hypothetical protein